MKIYQVRINTDELEGVTLFFAYRPTTDKIIAELKNRDWEDTDTDRYDKITEKDYDITSHNLAGYEEPKPNIWSYAPATNTPPEDVTLTVWCNNKEHAES